MEQTGIVFNIQRFCLHDGPGIRTTVFLKGCPLRCTWCHNPESQAAKPELFYIADRCIGCGSCTTACSSHAHELTDDSHIFHRTLCKACGSCADLCYSGALEQAGKTMTAEAVLKEVLKDQVFYESSGGGLTLSGGEPLFQPDFAYALLKSAKQQGLHTCIETCGFADKDLLFKIAAVTDLFLYDWKITSDSLHRQYTQQSNCIIRENLMLLDKHGSATILRCPVIPSVNDTDEHFKGIAELANTLNHILHIEIEPYHPLGSDKYQQLGKAADHFPVPDSQIVGQWVTAIQKQTDKTVWSASFMAPRG